MSAEPSGEDESRQTPDPTSVRNRERRPWKPNGNRRVWVYLWEFFGNLVQPWDRGVLDAHYINCGSTSVVREHLESARRRRRGPLAMISGWRRQYLDGLIWSLESELARRLR